MTKAGEDDGERSCNFILILYSSSEQIISYNLYSTTNYLALCTHYFNYFRLPRVFSLFYTLIPLVWILSNLYKNSDKLRSVGWRSFIVYWLIRWESPPSIWFRVTRKPGCTGLVRDSRVRNWLWLGKVLAPLTHPTWGKLLCGFDIIKKF